MNTNPQRGFYIVPTRAPATPLNLELGVVYSPRVPTPPFVAFDAIEVGTDVFEVRGYNMEDGAITMMFHGHLLRTYQRLAAHLRMDVTPETFFKTE